MCTAISTGDIMMKPQRVGIIGAGHIAQSHAQLWQGEADVVAVCSRQYHKAVSLANEYGIPVVCTDAEALIQRDDIDIVCITTPHHLHHPFAVQAVNAGKHVFCEKPLALNVTEARDMWETSHNAGVKTGIQFSERFHWPSLIRLREMIQEGVLGEIQYFEGAWAFDWARSPDHPMSWRFQRDKAGTGALGDLGAYMIDAARWLIGEIASVSGHLVTYIKQRPLIPDLYDFAEIRQMQRENDLPKSTKIGDVENDDVCTVMVLFENGAHGIIRASRMQRFNTIRVEGSLGVCTWDLQNRILMHRSHRQEHYTEVPVQSGTTSPSMYTQFLANIRDDTDLPPTFYDGLKVQEVIDAVVKSAEDKRWVNP